MKEIKELTKSEILYIYNNITKSNKFLMTKLSLDYKKELKKFKHLKEKLRFNNKDTIDFIINNKDMSAGEIDKMKNLPTGTARFLANINNISLKKKKNSFTQKEIEFAKRYYEKYGAEYLSNKLGIKISRARTLGETLKIKSGARKKYSNIEKEKIIKQYMETKDIDLIAKEYNRTPHAIENFLSRRGILDSKKTSSKFYVTRPERYIINFFNKHLNANIPDKTKKENRQYFFNVVERYEIDIPIYINDIKIAIEYDGHRWHENSIDHDTRKDQKLKEAGYIVFRISSKDHNNNYYNLNSLDKVLYDVVKKIKNLTGSL